MAFAIVTSEKKLNVLIGDAITQSTSAALPGITSTAEKLTDAIYAAAGRLLSPELNNPTAPNPVTKILERLGNEHLARMVPERIKQSVGAITSDAAKLIVKSKRLFEVTPWPKEARASNCRVNSGDNASSAYAAGKSLSKPRKQRKTSTNSRQSVVSELEIVLDEHSPAATEQTERAVASEHHSDPVQKFEVEFVYSTQTEDVGGEDVVTVEYSLVGQKPTIREPRDFTFPNGENLMVAIFRDQDLAEAYHNCEKSRILDECNENSEQGRGNSDSCAALEVSEEYHSDASVELSAGPTLRKRRIQPEPHDIQNKRARREQLNKQIAQLRLDIEQLDVELGESTGVAGLPESHATAAFAGLGTRKDDTNAAVVGITPGVGQAL